jgi:hypothetical protein
MESDKLRRVITATNKYASNLDKETLIVIAHKNKGLHIN